MCGQLRKSGDGCSVRPAAVVINNKDCRPARSWQWFGGLCRNSLQRGPCKSSIGSSTRKYYPDAQAHQVAGMALPRLTVICRNRTIRCTPIWAAASDFWQLCESQRTYRYSEHLPCQWICVRNISYIIHLPAAYRQHSKNYPTILFFDVVLKQISQHALIAHARVIIQKRQRLVQ